MRFHALAVDYDGTLATNGLVDEPTVDALLRLRQTQRRIVLVTGRLLEPLLDAFPEIGLCDLVVAENGALLYEPDTRTVQLLAEAIPREFVEKLAERGVPVSEVGRVILATCVPYESVVLEAIRDMALELQIVFNKGAVMVLPAGVNKASGLRAALYELGLSPHNAVGVGDAENDEAFLKLCEASAAVSNALDPLKKQADVVLHGVGSKGVVELIDRLIAHDLGELLDRSGGGILLGTNDADQEIRVPVYGTRLLIIGDSASGKSKFAVSILTQLMELGFQTCVIDPEGDFQTISGPIVLGTREHVPSVEEVMQVIQQPDKSCVVSLFAAKAEEQPAQFARLYRALQDHRAHTGRPHWNIIDEAHYPVSTAWKPLDDLHLEDFRSVMYVTAYPDKMPPAVLKHIDAVVAISDQPEKLLAKYGQLIGEAPPAIAPPADGREHRAIAWQRAKGPPYWLRRMAPRGEHQRHQHQYFDGDMNPQDQFYFRGPKGELNLAAKNLRTFMDLAHGVDEETWLYHLARGDYARWFRDKIQDPQLSQAAEKLQAADDAPAEESRQKISELIRQLYIKEL